MEKERQGGRMPKIPDERQEQKAWLMEQIQCLSNRYEEDVLKLRREIHREPELAFREFKTAEKIRQALSPMGLALRTGIAGTGLIADLEGKAPGKNLLLRADMDALPMGEENDLPFCSRNPGVMHACGHDVHAANLAGVARILWELREYWNGSVRFVFQPAEESGGGREMIRAGILEDKKFDASLALHVEASARPGHFVLGWGNITAYSDRFTITVRGKKTHSARPHKGVDAIAIAAQVITALNGLLLKEIDPLKQATYSIGMIQGGTAPNIIADKVELTGMMRNVTAETRQVLAERLKSVSEGIASALGGSAEFTLFEGYPSVYNDPALTDFVAREISAQSARWVSDLVPDLAGQELLIRETQPILGAEDYGFYTQKLPCCFYRVSTGNQAPTHSTRFMVEEPYIKLCTRSLASLAVSYLLGP